MVCLSVCRRMQSLDVEMDEVKNWINTKNEELSMRIR